MGRPISSKGCRYKARFFANKGEASQQVHPDLSLGFSCNSFTAMRDASKSASANAIYILSNRHAEGEHGEKKINFWEGPTRISEWKEEQVRQS